MVSNLVIIVLFVLIMWCGLQLCVLYSDNNVILTLNVFSSLSFPDVVIVFDWITNVFLNMVLLVSSLVLIYSYSYIGGSWATSKFVSILFVFIVSMVVLSVSGDVFWVIVGWDGLGVSSFCLIVFYQNWKSVEGGLVTFVCNRFGDLFILISLACLMCEGLSMCLDSPCLSSWAIYVLVVVGGMTKSAQVPFSAWLPLAMAAPTPVSSLVHSSTLVTAGVFLTCRFIGAFSQWCLSVIYLISSFTILLAGVSSLFEWDLKNVVALSTLTHIGLMLNVASLGSVGPCLLHITIHAFFKSMLFIAVGVVIHSSDSWQDLRRVNIESNDVNWPIVWVSLISIVGAPFLSGFCSKEVVLTSYSSEGSLLLSLPFWFGVAFTMAYSFRISFYLLNVRNCLPLIVRSGAFCSPVMMCGVVLSTIGNYVVWEISWKSSFMVSILDSCSKSFLLLVVVLGSLVGLLSVSAINLTRLFNNMWNSSSFTAVWSGLFYHGSWLMLNRFDTNGSLGSLVTDTIVFVLGSMTCLKQYFITWPVFLLKIFLTILTTLVILGGLSI